MRVFLLITLLLFCQQSHASIDPFALYGSIEREDHDVVSALLEKYSIDNLEMLDLYLAGKIFIERYMDAQLSDSEKIKETVFKNIFPTYSKNNESQIVDKGQYKRAVREIKYKELYFNAYLLKVDEAWKIRKVDGDEVSYENVDGHNIMDLVEFLYAMSSLGDSKGDYNVKKLLALIQVKHQIEEDVEKQGRYMMSYEKNFWAEHDLGSDLIEKASQTIYTFSYFHSPSNRTAGFYGLDGQKMYGNFSIFGNVTYAWLLEHHLENNDAYTELKFLPKLGVTYRDLIKNKLELKELYGENFEFDELESLENHRYMGKLTFYT